MTTNPSPTTTKKERPMAEKKRVSAGVLALSLFAGWMWHAAETASPGITGKETNQMGTAAAGGLTGALDAAKAGAQNAGLGNMLTPPDTTGSGQVGGVAGGN